MSYAERTEPARRRKLEQIVRLLQIGVALLGILVVTQVGTGTLVAMGLAAIAVDLVVTALVAVGTDRPPVGVGSGPADDTDRRDAR